MSRRVLRGFDPSRLRESRLAARSGAGLTIAETARAAGVSAATIYQWESGIRTPQVDVLAAVTAVLDIRIEDVVNVPLDERFPSDLRVLRGLTQPQLGQMAELPTAVVGRIERADIPLTDDKLEVLSKLVGVEQPVYRAAYERARRRPAGTLA
ncbi:transcriptional regulator, XRE family [Rhodococcoides kroppenstedtii]|uniref:Transcriptional regulator, XRE family n=1 Tax=Rhodococcoides kroppenstedtii TaxID=293050 RepID=A0A1I0T2Q9_9NOCA|nr:transcriptional regulator, XRE family [Rhodococcus kroppenstedtii]